MRKKNVFVILLVLLLANVYDSRARNNHPLRFLNAAEDADAPAFRFGYGLGSYFYHISGPEIYMWRINNRYADGLVRILDVKDKFGSLQNFNAFQFIFDSPTPNSDGRFHIGFAWTIRRKTSDATYTYDTGNNTAVIERTEKVKMSMNMGAFTFDWRPAILPHFRLGTSMDLGFLRTKIKYKDPAITEGKWFPWFYSQRFLGSGVSPKTPIAGYGFFMMYDFSFLSLRLSHTRPIMDGSMSSQTKKYTNLPDSEKVFPISNTQVSLLIKISR